MCAFIHKHSFSSLLYLLEKIRKKFASLVDKEGKLFYSSDITVIRDIDGYFLKTIMTNASLETLPAELLFRIFNHLDTYSIICSVRRVCQRFYHITDGYDQYELKINSWSHLHLEKILRHVQPENITSLILNDKWADADQIERFFSLIDISRLTRLRSITLSEVKNSEHYESLNSLPIANLISLRIHSDGDYRHNTAAFISNVITQPMFNQLYLIESNYRITQLSGTSTFNIQHLTIKSCSLTEYSLLLQRLPHLQTFKIQQFIMNQSMGSSSSTSIPHRQLMSLFIGNSSLSMADFEQLLSLTPSLSTLRLMSHRSSNIDSILNGSDWADLIQTKLSNLKTFHFFFSYDLGETNDAKDVDLIIDQFRTPFWLEEKKWIVACDYALKWHIINFYTTPRDSWNCVQDSSSIIPSTYSYSLFTIRFDCTWMEGAFHPNVHLAYITNGIIQTSVCKDSGFLLRKLFSVFFSLK